MYRFASSASVRATGAARRSPPSRCSTLTMSGSTIASPATSRSASVARPRTPAPHVSVVATSAATAPATSTSRRCDRVSASVATTPIHSTRYQVGHVPGACSTTGAIAAASVASSGATHGGRPRRAPSPALPMAATPMKSDAAARKSAISHPSQSSTATPLSGGDTPAERAQQRGRRGENRERDRHGDPSSREAQPAAQHEEQCEQHDHRGRPERADGGGEWPADLRVVDRRIEEDAAPRECIERHERKQREGDRERQQSAEQRALPAPRRDEEAREGEREQQRAREPHAHERAEPRLLFARRHRVRDEQRVGAPR